MQFSVKFWLNNTLAPFRLGNPGSATAKSKAEYQCEINSVHFVINIRIHLAKSRTISFYTFTIFFCFNYKDQYSGYFLALLVRFINNVDLVPSPGGVSQLRKMKNWQESKTYKPKVINKNRTFTFACRLHVLVPVKMVHLLSSQYKVQGEIKYYLSTNLEFYEF